MNIQARKLNIIEEFLGITNVDSILKIESFIKQEKKNNLEQNLNPMSISDFNKMIDQAKKDSEEGRVISHQDLKTKIKSWK